MITLLLFSFVFANYEFYNNSKLHLTLSTNCVRSDRWTNCKAIQPLKKKINYTHINGIENGSAICNTLTNAKVKFLLDKRRNMRSVCQFSDQSWIDLGSLEYYADNKITLPLKP